MSTTGKRKITSWDELLQSTMNQPPTGEWWKWEILFSRLLAQDFKLPRTPKMTETEWLHSDDPETMLKYIQHENIVPLKNPPKSYWQPSSNRKIALFACNCLNFRGKLKPEFGGASERHWISAEHGGNPPHGPYAAPTTVTSWAAAWASGPAHDYPSAFEKTELLRDLFHNPFQPPLDVFPQHYARWNDGTIPRIAQGIYEEQRFGDMPILADAFLDAGCEDEELLQHLRGYKKCVACGGDGTYDADNVVTELVSKMTCRVCNGKCWVPFFICEKLGISHVRGCWALDLILGKA